MRGTGGEVKDTHGAGARAEKTVQVVERQLTESTGGREPSDGVESEKVERAKLRNEESALEREQNETRTRRQRMVGLRSMDGLACPVGHDRSCSSDRGDTGCSSRAIRCPSSARAGGKEKQTLTSW